MIRTDTLRKVVAVLLTVTTLASSMTAGVVLWTDPVAAHGDHTDGGGAEGTDQWATDSAAFRVETVVSGLQFPTEATFLPDGRMLVLEQGGRIVVYDPATDGQGTYLQLSDIDSDRERGLIGIALDPNFAQNGYLYLYYARASTPENVLARFTHEERSGGTTSRAGSERVLWRNEIRVGKNRVCCHFGGGLDVGPDGKLYLTTGDEFQGERAQDLSIPDGKIIRLNRDGSIPQDNPYVGDGDPNTLDEIWASGLRNPYRAKFDDATGRLYVGEVGGNEEPDSQEDIHVGRAGANYGWPNCEGVCSDPAYDDPIYTYSHGDSGDPPGAAVTVGPVYRAGTYPTEYDGVLFYSDYNDGWIKYLVLRSDGSVAGSYNFEPNAGAVVASAVGPDGSLYTVNYAAGEIRRYVYEGSGNAAPVIQSATATPESGSPPLTVSFDASATDADGDALSYAWSFGDGTAAQGAGVAHTYDAAGTYDATVAVSDGTTTVRSAPIRIRVGSGPEATITAPADGTTFRAGEGVVVSGSASDPEDGALTGSSLRWSVRFTHNDHFHPEFETTGDSFVLDVPTTGHAFSGDTGYEVTLTATDSDGITATDTISLVPEEVDVTLLTDPAGLSLTLDGIPRSTAGGGYTFDSAIGFEHEIAAPQSVCSEGTTYEFVGWSDGDSRVRTYVVPDADATLTAEYAAAGSCQGLPAGLVAQYDADSGVQTGANGVTGWADGSGNGNDLTARGAPQFDPSGANGAGAVVFDGVDDALVLAGPTGLPTGSADRTVFVAANYRSEGFGGFAYGTPSRNDAFGLVVSDTGALTVQGWGRANDYQSGTAGTGAGWLLQGVVYDNGGFTHYRDGQVIDSGAHAFTTTADGVVLGAELNENTHVAMDVAAVYVYDRALSAAERQQVEAYLTETYLTGTGGGGTTDAPPTANDDSIVVDRGTAASVAVLGNDADDVGLDPASVSIVAAPAAGTATPNPDGTVTYAHDGSETTSDSFTYTVADTAGQTSNAATVTVSVRSDTGGGTSDVPVSNGLVAHFETDAGVQTSGSAVTTWADQSGSGNDLTARGAPTLQTGVVGGEDAVSFDGTDDLLDRSGLTGLPAGNSDRTMFVVADYVDNGGEFGGVAYGRGSRNKAFGLVVNDAGRLTVQGFGGGNDFPSDVQGVGAGWLTQSVVHESGQFTHYANGQQIATGAHVFDTRAQEFVVGGEITPAPYTEMRVAAVLVYDRALADTERQQVESYLQAKYLGGGGGGGGTTDAPPTATDDAATVNAGESATIAVLANDADDVGLDPASVSVVSGPSAGTATPNPDGTVTYAHDGSATTEDSFTYVVSDTAGQASNEATVTVSVQSDTGGGTSDVPVSNGLVAHFETDSGVQTGANGVTGWTDQSGTGNDLTARGAPTLQTGAAGGEDAIYFDGTDDLLDRSGLTGLPAGNSDRTMFVVADYVDNGGEFGGVAYGRGSRNKAFGLVVNDVGRLTVQGFGGGNDFPSDVQGVGAGWVLHGVVHENGQFTHYAGGTQIGSGAHAFDTRAQEFVVGGEITPAPYTEMRVAAVLVYDRALSDTERQQVESYLQAKYLGGGTGGGSGGDGTGGGDGGTGDGTTDAAPTANDDTAAVTAGESTTIAVLGNDADDVGLDPASVSVVSGPAFGTATPNADGTVTYAHDGSATTEDSFAYVVSDTAGQASNAATVTVTVLAGGGGGDGGDGTTDGLVTNGLVAQFETDAGVQTSGSAVRAWTDGSGNGNDLTARGAPTLQTGAANGQDAIYFDGQDDLLDRSGLTGLPAGDADRSMFVVADYVDNGGEFGGVAYGRGSRNKAFGLVVDDAGRLTVQGFGGGNDFPSDVQGVGAGWVLHGVVHQNGQFTHYADGQQVGSGAHAFDTRAQEFVVGGEITPAPYTEIRVAAVLVYDRALSDTERQQVEAYLREKYAT